MSTRAQIAIEIGPGEWAQVYVHYDGYPSHMLPALERWKPADILAAIEIRQVTAEEIEAFFDQYGLYTPKVELQRDKPVDVVEGEVV